MTSSLSPRFSVWRCWLRNSLCAIGALLVGLASAGCDGAGADEPAPNPEPTPAPAGPAMLRVSGDVQGVHDPVLVEEDGSYYLFSTGGPGALGVQIRCSTNFLAWNVCGSVFDEAPAWAQEAVQGVENLWAPDVIFMDGQYHLYYSASTFGSNRSAIGLATSPTLDQSSEDYAWTDQGPVIQSYGADDYNAIDPNVVIDQEGTPWMTFGSYWSGIKLVELSAETGQLAAEDPQLYALAARPNASAIEAPFITYRDGYYYLFVSYDACCQGVESTYNVRVGRAEEVTGPYVDQSGQAMTAGGGTLLIEGTERWKGTGHQAFFEEDGETYLVYHAYDAFSSGVPTLRISPLVWEDGWPAIEREGAE